MSSSHNFHDAFQMALLIERKEPAATDEQNDGGLDGEQQIKEKPKKEGNQTNFIQEYLRWEPEPIYSLVDPKHDANALSRAFYKTNQNRKPLLFFGDRVDPTAETVLWQGSTTQYHSELIRDRLAPRKSHQKQTFLIPQEYLLENDKYQIHVLMLAQFKPTIKTQGNLLHVPEYLVPCVPVKHLDILTLHSDFMDTLRMMYYDQETQGQLYSMSDLNYKKLSAS